MTRIVAGVAKGRRIVVPKGPTRPTSDRAREALFSTLSTLTDLEGAKVLDLYAGSGAVGLEAASRGAESVVLVEADGRAAAVAAENIRTLDLRQVTVAKGRAERFVASAAEAPFDILFADPPYAVAAASVAAVLTAALSNGYLAADAIVVVERPTGEPWQWPERFVTVRHRSYGAGTLWYGRPS